MSSSMRKNVLLNYFFIFGMIVNLFVPVIPLQGVYFYPVYFFSLVVFILWFYNSSISEEPFIISKKIYYPSIIVFFMSCSFFFPILNFNTNIYLDYFVYELVLYLIMIPFFLMFNHLVINEKQINTVVLFSFGVFIIVGILQWIGFEKAVTLYAFEDHIEAALDGSRLVITGSDPNVGSIICSFFVLYFFSSFIIKKSFLYFLMMLFSVALLFKTQGRTTIIGTGFVFFAYLIFFAKIKIIYRVFLILLIPLTILYFSSFFDLFYLVEGLSDLGEGSNMSVNVRFENVYYAFDNFRLSPVFGWGSALEHQGTVRNIDSELFLILQRYGLFGFLVIFSIIFRLLKIGFKYRNVKLGSFVFLMTFSLIFNMLTNTVFFGAQTVSIIVFLIFLTYFLEHNEKNNIPPSITN